MGDYLNPPRPKGATEREIVVIAEAHRAACLMTERQHVTAIQDAVKLLVRLIEDRGKRVVFDEHYDRPHDD